MTVSITSIEQQAIDTLRVFGAELPSLANSGHPGAPMGCAAMAYMLYTKHMRHNPRNPSWANRDRFVLSNGHACALQYSILSLCGYDISREDLMKFRQLNSKTPGHPECGHTPGIEVTTGPLGQGFASAVGLAIAEKHLAATYNQPGFELFTNRTFVVVGDGCMQEGITSEAASLAGHLKLGNLVALYDDNNITIDGSTDLSFTEDVKARFESYGWRTVVVENGHVDVSALNRALESVLSLNSDSKPTLLLVKTVIGFGSVHQGTSGVHGSPLKPEDIMQLKVSLGMDPSQGPLYVSEAVKSEYQKCIPRGESMNEQWDSLLKEYTAAFPELGNQLVRQLNKEFPENWKLKLLSSFPEFIPSSSPIATRQASGMVLNAVANMLPELLGGSADLTPSNLTFLKSSKGFQHTSPEGRYIYFGVREHAMAAISNGLAAYGMLIPFCATFLNFISYAMGAVTVSALSQLGVIYIMTHDSLGLGEDGPTHQPTNSLAMIRALPNSITLRPADANETLGSYIIAIENRTRPSVLALSRQALPHLDNSCPLKTALGAYVIYESACTAPSSPDFILIASGSEVHLAIEASKSLSKDHHMCVRVVSMPSMELFDEQPLAYRSSVLPAHVPVLSIEALSVKTWEAYAHFSIGMTTFGKSAPAKDLFAEFGFTTANIIEKALKIKDYFKKTSGPVPQLFTQRPSLNQL